MSILRRARTLDGNTGLARLVTRAARQRGFTLIEALVALVILSGAGMALFAWINASIISVTRVETANLRSTGVANAIEYMQSVNPMAAPAGSAKLGDTTIEWSSMPLTDDVDGAGYPRGTSNFRLALYRTSVRGSRPRDPAWFEFKLELVGYRKVREGAGSLF